MHVYYDVVSICELCISVYGEQKYGRKYNYVIGIKNYILV